MARSRLGLFAEFFFNGHKYKLPLRHHLKVSAMQLVGIYGVYELYKWNTATNIMENVPYSDGVTVNPLTYLDPNLSHHNTEKDQDIRNTVFYQCYSDVWRLQNALIRKAYRDMGFKGRVVIYRPKTDSIRLYSDGQQVYYPNSTDEYYTSEYTSFTSFLGGKRTAFFSAPNAELTPNDQLYAIAAREAAHTLRHHDEMALALAVICSSDLLFPQLFFLKIGLLSLGAIAWPHFSSKDAESYSSRKVRTTAQLLEVLDNKYELLRKTTRQSRRYDANLDVSGMVQRVDFTLMELMGLSIKQRELALFKQGSSIPSTFLNSKGFQEFQKLYREVHEMSKTRCEEESPRTICIEDDARPIDFEKLREHQDMTNNKLQKFEASGGFEFSSQENISKARRGR